MSRGRRPFDPKREKEEADPGVADIESAEEEGVLILSSNNEDIPVQTLLPPEAYTVSIDLSDAYRHFPIGRHFSPYLGLILERKGYVFRAMPFGLNIAPRIFTKVIDAVVQQLWKKGLQVAAYLDNWLAWAPLALEYSEATTQVVRFLQSLGFQINFKKSRLTPAQVFQWLEIHSNLVPFPFYTSLQEKRSQSGL
ncbi:uncharacterized protein [Palaemon carinicauda]|uniref:uncharacterized protein n=1 Tax=Palaemon carinicauda TaxID=392227 RepID=UPI0035B68EB4